MQQHTGQHVLSAFDRLFGVHHESHLGITSATIDLAREVSVGEVQKAEDGPIASCGKTGRLRFGSPRRMRLRIFPCERPRCGRPDPSHRSV